MMPQVQSPEQTDGQIAQDPQPSFSEAAAQPVFVTEQHKQQDQQLRASQQQVPPIHMQQFMNAPADPELFKQATPNINVDDQTQQAHTRTRPRGRYEQRGMPRAMR